MDVVFGYLFLEGFVRGAVYVDTFAEIVESVAKGEREFSLGAISVSDNAGICIAGFIGMVLEPMLCEHSVGVGRGWCKER